MPYPPPIRGHPLFLVYSVYSLIGFFSTIRTHPHHHETKALIHSCSIHMNRSQFEDYLLATT
ncbi:hypothetical protein [Rubritalea tangerina]|uniref:hypothetical protein n=1 Tax=Rubritalea tangerina TaxID=430798 RepID=UPI003612D21F